MIANIEANGFLIKIENIEGKVKITAERDGEIVEELELDEKEFEEGSEPKEEKTDSDLKTFDEYSGEEKEEETEEESDEEKEEEKVEESIKTFDKFFK
jgi:Mg-chelatase subunit ChlI